MGLALLNRLCGFLLVNLREGDICQLTLSFDQDGIYLYFIVGACDASGRRYNLIVVSVASV